MAFTYISKFLHEYFQILHHNHTNTSYYGDILIIITIIIGLILIYYSKFRISQCNLLGKLYIIFTLLCSSTILIGLYQGFYSYRNDLRTAYGKETAERLCYAYETEATTIENDSILGVRLLAIHDVNDPWFHNNGMSIYTLMCFYGIGVTCIITLIQWFSIQNTSNTMYIRQKKSNKVSIMKEFLRRASTPFVLPDQLNSLTQRRFTINYNAPNAVVERLGSLIMSWNITLALVAYFFAPLPICRFITTLGIVHNFFEIWIIRELGLSSPKLKKFRWIAPVWAFGEILGGILLGTVESQFMTFGLMGATCDLTLFFISTFIIYDTKQLGRFYAALAFYAHCTYVALYFANCFFMPPLGKILGVYLNFFASMFASYSMCHIREHALSTNKNY